MKYKISWVEKKTGKSGKEYLEMTLRELGENGVEGDEIRKVTTFTLTYMAGEEIQGAIIQNGNFRNFKELNEPNFIKANNFKSQQIEKAVERKEQGITKFQDNKEWSIKVASTMRMAVDLAIAEGKPETSVILKWREWCWNNWDVADDQYPPFT